MPEEHTPSPPEPLWPEPGGDAFRTTLKGHRDRLNWSQERLALEAGADHTLISRLESGKREPTRDAVLKLAAGLDLRTVERDELLILAGYTPSAMQRLMSMARDSTIVRAYAMLWDQNLPAEVRRYARDAIEALLAIIEQQTG